MSKGLGRGLSALIGGDFTLDNALNQYSEATIEGRKPTLIEIDKINPCRYQPRKKFDDSTIAELADSIKKHGLIQPIVVRAIAGGKYELIAGERRLRASKFAGVNKIEAIIKPVNDMQAAELSLIENLQRQDLSPIEEAEAYRALIEMFGFTQEQLSHILAKSRSHVTNMLRLLNLPRKVRNYLEEGKLSAGHAKLLINNGKASELAEKIIERGLSVRQATDLVRTYGKQIPKKGMAVTKAGTRDEDLITIENSLQQKIGMKVKINDAGNEGGKIAIYFKNLQQLDLILRKLENI